MNTFPLTAASVRQAYSHGKDATPVRRAYIHRKNAVCLSWSLRPCVFSLFLFVLGSATAQTGSTGYESVNVPVSAHSAALGGQNVSAIEDDITFLFTNPALLSNVATNTLCFDFMSYYSSSTKMAAALSRQAGERGTWAVAAQLLSYGEMTETDADYHQLGTFMPSDITLQGGYAYLLSDHWSGGVQAKLLMQQYGDYKSTALAVDLGLDYYDEQRGFSFGIAAQNLGGEVDALYEKRQKLPFNLVLGVSKDLANAPLRISVTLADLTHWSKSYFQTSDDKRLSGGRVFTNHLSLGLDIFPSAQTWIALGYNFRRAYEMKVDGKSHWAGLSLGAGLSLRRLKIGLAYGKYHVASSSLMGNVAYSF